MSISKHIYPDTAQSMRSFRCDEVSCMKAFARRSDLIRHKRIHANDRPWLCDYPGCPRAFIQRSALLVHIRIHTGERPHKCLQKDCLKAFSDSSSLARHRRTHTGCRPYKCPVEACQKTYCRNTSLTKHVRKRHPLSKPNQVRAAVARTVGASSLEEKRKLSNSSVDIDPCANSQPSTPTNPSVRLWDSGGEEFLKLPPSPILQFPLPPRVVGPPCLLDTEYMARFSAVKKEQLRDPTNETVMDLSSAYCYPSPAESITRTRITPAILEDTADSSAYLQSYTFPNPNESDRHVPRTPKMAYCQTLSPAADYTSRFQLDTPQSPSATYYTLPSLNMRRSISQQDVTCRPFGQFEGIESTQQHHPYDFAQILDYSDPYPRCYRMSSHLLHRSDDMSKSPTNRALLAPLLRRVSSAPITMIH